MISYDLGSRSLGSDLGSRSQDPPPCLEVTNDLRGFTPIRPAIAWEYAYVVTSEMKKQAMMPGIRSKAIWHRQKRKSEVDLTRDVSS